MCFLFPVSIKWILEENPSVHYFHFLDSSLEGRWQHMWMVHAIGCRQQGQARWPTRHTLALPTRNCKNDCLASNEKSSHNHVSCIACKVFGKICIL